MIWLLPAKDRTMINVIGIIGFMLSILGLIIAYIQILSVKQITQITQQKVEDGIQLNNDILMISDLSRKAAIVDEIQGYLKDDKIDMCILRMKDLKLILNSLRYQSQYSQLFSKKQFSNAFQSFNIDLNNFQTAHLNNRIDKEIVLRNLEELSTLLLSVEVKLKTPRT